MEKIPTAENYIKTNLTDFWEGGKAQYTGEDVAKAMVTFAKLHVEAALKAAVKCLPYDDKMNQSLLDERAILNSYPLENIK